MLLLRYLGYSVKGELDHDLEVTHEKELNVLRFEVDTGKIYPVVFNIHIDEIDEFVSFITDAAKTMQDINESELEL